MKQEILDGNKLIAEFMGAEWKQDDYNEWGYLFPDKSPGFPDWNKFRQIESLKYHTSWDWLMPVVEKAFNTTSQDDMTFAGLVLFEYGICASIEDIWKAAVEYVKWYNTHTHSETKTIK